MGPLVVTEKLTIWSRTLRLAAGLTISIAFFVVAELILLLVGVAGYPPLFVPVEGAPNYLQPNDRVVLRFLANEGEAPSISMDSTFFKADKPADTFRVIVQGGSTAAGFPYGKWASPAGMLKHRLRRSFPGKDIEVVSTAMSAINSYALLDFADEIIAQRPDVVLIYAGHNEYLGFLGVASTYSSSQSRALTIAIMKLRRLRLYRLLERSLSISSVPQTRTGTLMARIAGERRIPYGSAQYDRGMQQLRGNLDALLSRYSDAGVPVFVGTVASNEGDQAPFTSALAPDSNQGAWRKKYANGITALDAGDAAEAVTALEAAISYDDGAADAWFALGQAHRLLGSNKEAREAFRAARDRDQLRFRAPSAFNDVIRELATRYGATLVDVESAMAAESPGGIIGDELLLEHLHPNERGYFLLADAFFDAMGTQGLIGPWRQAVDDTTAWIERPVTRIDILAAQYRLDRLLADWPFQVETEHVSLPTPTDPLERIAQDWFTSRIPWAEAMNRALIHYKQQGDIDNATRVALNLAEAFHFWSHAQFMAGQLLAKKGESGVALNYFRRAVELDPQAHYLLALARAYSAAKRPEDARRTLGVLLAREPEHAAALAMMRKLQ